MRLDRALAVIKNICFSNAFLYAVIILMAFFLVDFRHLDTRVKMRRLNDVRPGSLSQLLLLSRGEIPPADVNWPELLKYFRLIVRYMPHEDVSMMFLGIAEYYSGDPKSALELLQHSAEGNPFIFWNVYNAGVLAFEQGNMSLALRYLERALLLPPERLPPAIKASVLYRQILAAAKEPVDINVDIRQARTNVLVLRAAAYYYANEHEKARDAAVFALDKVLPQDTEPLYFYAGAASLSLNQLPLALNFFNACIRLKSQNPLVYRYSGEIVGKMGKGEESRSLLKIAGSLRRARDAGFPYPQRLGLRFF